MKTHAEETIRFTIPEGAWSEVLWGSGDDPSNRDRLLAQVCVNGTYHHLEAYRIRYTRGGELILANPAMEKELMPTLQDLYDGAYETVTIRGEEYVLFMFPHAV